MCNNDKFDNLSSPIVALMQFLCVAHRTEWTLARRRRHWHCYQYCKKCINIRVQYKFWFVTLSVCSNVCGFCPSTIFQRVFHLATSSRNACRQYPYEKNQSLNLLSDLLMYGAQLIFLNISSKVLTLILGLEPDIFTLQANSPTIVLLTVNDKLNLVFYSMSRESLWR